MKQRLLLAGVLLMLCSAPGQVAERVVTVFAASSMTDVLEDVGKAYTASSKVPVRFSFASSAALARQLESGAPADVFVSADQDWMDYVAARGLVQPATRAEHCHRQQRDGGNYERCAEDEARDRGHGPRVGQPGWSNPFAERRPAALP